MSNAKNIDPQPKKENEQDSDPITEPNEVPESNDEKIDQDFPGYPHYPAKEDILNPDNTTERVDVDLENINRSTRTVRLQEKDEARSQQPATDDMEDDDLGIVAGTEADVTEDDLLILESTDGIIGRNKEEDLFTVDSLSGTNAEELDLPGTELDDNDEALGEEDEENNYYSLGSDKEVFTEEEKE